jgi:uncharacterized protein
MVPISIQRAVARVSSALPQNTDLPDVFLQTLTNTLNTTLRPQSDGTVFVITGDIPAMWLRDSAAQVRVYLALAKEDTEFAQLIAGVVRKQVQCVQRDVYANAFNESDNGRCHNRDKTEMSGWIWERKYELDSLCAPLTLAHDLWQQTGRMDHLDADFARAARLIVNTIKLEQDHTKSPYTFERLEGPPSDTLTNEGRGNPVGYTGMSWCGFRPSDDACQFNYLVPANMLAVSALNKLAALPISNSELKRDASHLAQSIRTGIETHARVQHPLHGEVYAYEVDGLGHHNIMDDANVPSLLAAPYMGYCRADDPIYQSTRALILSRTNPFYYEGTAARGIGSPHTPPNHIWPIALCIQGLTAETHDEKRAMLDMLLATHAGTGLMHESFHKDDPATFTRPWFAWANSLFAEFVMSLCH